MSFIICCCNVVAVIVVVDTKGFVKLFNVGAKMWLSMAVFISKFGFNVVAMIGIGDCSTKGLSIDDEVMLAVVIIVVDVAVVLLVVDGIMGDGGSENILNT